LQLPCFGVLGLLAFSAMSNADSALCAIQLSPAPPDGAFITASPARWVVRTASRTGLYFIRSATTGFTTSVNRASVWATFEGLELGKGKLSRPVLRGLGEPQGRLATRCIGLTHRQGAKAPCVYRPLGYSVPIGGHKRRQRIHGTARPSQVPSDGRLVMNASQLCRAGLLGQVLSFRWPREGGPLKCRADNIKRLNVRSPVQEFSENLQHFRITA
jgi:hypothetical protein